MKIQNILRLHTPTNTTHSTAASGTSPNLGEEFSNSPSKLEWVARSAEGVCEKTDTLHSQQADSSLGSSFKNKEA